MYVLLLAIILFAAPQNHVDKNIPAKNKQNHASSKSNSKTLSAVPANSPSPDPTPSPKSEQEQNNTDNKTKRIEIVPQSDSWFKGYVIFTGVIAAINLFMLVAMLRQRNVMAEQLQEMKEAGNKTESLIGTARENATTALLTANAFINAERAWIVLELIESYEANRKMFKAVLTNYGRSPAHVIGYNISHAYTMTIADLPPEPRPYTHTEVAQPLLVPNEEFEVQQVPAVYPHELPKTITQQPFLYWGVIRYKDSIGNLEHETWFCRRYNVHTREFDMVGPPSYNRYT